MIYLKLVLVFTIFSIGLDIIFKKNIDENARFIIGDPNYSSNTFSLRYLIGTYIIFLIPILNILYISIQIILCIFNKEDEIIIHFKNMIDSKGGV